MEITTFTKLHDLLQAYPELEDKIINLAPPFKNLKNPLLRRTVGKIATLEKVAQIGNMEPDDFVNLLRREAGLPEIAVGGSPVIKPQMDASDPDWIKDAPQFTVDGTEMLSRGEHPLARINELMHQVQSGQYLLLITNFKPMPLIEAMQKQGYRIYFKSDQQNPEQSFTFIGK
jgi:hypothetical protein